MLRTLLVGVLAVSAAAACSSKADPPAAQPGVAAGKVVELTGKVTATRGTEVRTLAAGGEISADDVIDTAADSRIVILVAHNNARWDLGPNKHGKVGESLAWTAAKQDQPATAVIEESSTAGAHAEKSAATTGTTTPEAPKQQEEKSADKAAAAPAAFPDDDLQAKGGTPAPAAAVSSAPPPSPPPPPPPSPSRRKIEAPRPLAQPMAPKLTRPMDEGAKEVAPIEEESKSTRDSNTRSGEKNVAPSDSGASRSLGVASGGGAGPGAGSAVGVDPVRQLQTEIQQHFAKGRTAMRACFAATAPDVLIQITVTKGVYTITSVNGGASDKERACLATIAKGLSSTTKVDKPVYVKLTLAKP